MEFVDKSIEVNADIRDVYDAWTAFEDFPTFMEVVERVDVLPDDSLHWVAVIEDDIIEWDADMVEHIPEQSVSWEARDGRETGKVTFEKIGTNQTKVHYQLDYDPEAWDGDPQEIADWMSTRVSDALDAFKGLVEEDA